MNILYEDEVMKIIWDDENRILESVWKNFASDDEYKKPLEKLIELMISNKAVKILSDMRNMKPVSKSDQEWTEKEFMPKAIKAGVKYWALIFPASVLAQMSVKSMEQDIKNVIKPPFNQLNTDNIEDAKSWLNKAVE